MNLSPLLVLFRQLQEAGSEVRAKAKRGLAFERLLSDLFRQQGILMTEPFRIIGEQIDGAFEHKGWAYLVEAKWQESKKSTDALYAFQGKPDRRIEGTRGLFISMSGYHDTSAGRFAEGKKPNTILWSGEHILAVLEGKLTLPQLLDASIRYAAERSQLLIPLDRALAERTDRLFAVVLEASAAQVDAEISATVGRKFIPKLYVERSVQQDLDKLIHPERELQNILAEMAKAGIQPPRDLLDEVRGSSADPLSMLGSVLDSARSCHARPSRTEGDLGLFLDTLPSNPKGRMHVITSRAGMGKTNLLCHIAKNYAKQQPTIFLTGRSGVSEGQTVVSLIESKFARFLRDPFPRENCFDHLITLATAKQTSFLIIIDALNEHKDFDVMNAAISHLLYEVAGLPVVVLASCRDVYWPFFDTSLWPKSQWKPFDRHLDQFSVSESEKAITAYFDFYHIAARLSKEAEQKLSHPLILRFFCEAYGDPTSTVQIRLHEVPDIRLKVLFDEYLKRKLDSICHTAPRRFRTPRSVQDVLFSLADRMRTARCRDVPRDDLPKVTATQDLDSHESVYVAILGEDILLEEEPDAKTGQIKVVFTYDEFMEYMIARSMLRSMESREEIPARTLVEECQNGVVKFQSFVGVMEYLAVILREDWELAIWDQIDTQQSEFGCAVCRAIGKLGAEFIGAPELSALKSLTKSQSREVRMNSIQGLGIIASDRKCEVVYRSKSIECLVDVLREEEDIQLRVQAARPFEDDETVSVCTVGREFVTWWKNRKKAVRAMPVVFSDDEFLLLQTYERLMQHAGLEKIALSGDAEETIHLVEQLNPALVVTDMQKPSMSGEEMTRILKANPLTARIPVLLLSAICLSEAEGAKYAGLFCGFLSKPFSAQELLRTIEMTVAGKYGN